MTPAIQTRAVGEVTVNRANVAVSDTSAQRHCTFMLRLTHHVIFRVVDSRFRGHTDTHTVSMMERRLKGVLWLL